MNRKLEAGPGLLLLGAVLLFVSLFLNWYDDVINAWEAFEIVDLLLAVLALAVVAAAAGFFRPDIDAVDRRFLPALTVAALVIVVSQLLDSPPAVPGDTVEIGAWLAFAAVITMAAGALLTFGHVSFHVRVDKRDAVPDRTEQTRPIGSPGARAARTGDTEVAAESVRERITEDKTKT